MRVKSQQVIQLMNTYFDGNYTRFARELEVDPSHLHRYLTTGVGGGRKIIGAVLKFCMNKGINFEAYIEL